MKKSTKLAHIHHKMRTVSLFGVGLFIAALVVQSIVVGNIVWYFTMLKSSAGVNGAAVFAMFALAGLLAPLAAFLIGDRSTKIRSRYEHFYNGVLFAFMAVWLSMFLEFYVAPLMPGLKVPYLGDTMQALWPIVAALVVSIVIGIEYGHKRHQKLLHEYVPFQIALTVPLIALIAGSAWGLIRQLASPYPSAYGMVIIVPLLLWLVLLGISYYLSTEKTMPGKITESCVSASIGLFAVMIASQIPYYGFGLATDILVPSAIGTLVWLAFVYVYYYRLTDKLS